MSLALSQDVILLLSFLSLTPCFDHCCGQLFFRLLLFFGDSSLGALRRTKVHDKLFSPLCLSLPVFVSLSSPPQSEVFNLYHSPEQGFGVCQSPQAVSDPQASERIPER